VKIGQTERGVAGGQVSIEHKEKINALRDVKEEYFFAEKETENAKGRLIYARPKAGKMKT